MSFVGLLSISLSLSYVVSFSLSISLPAIRSDGCCVFSACAWALCVDSPVYSMLLPKLISLTASADALHCYGYPCRCLLIVCYSLYTHWNYDNLRIQYVYLSTNTCPYSRPHAMRLHASRLRHRSRPFVRIEHMPASNMRGFIEEVELYDL